MRDLPSGIYRHYRGGYYLLLGVAEHTEEGYLMAVYVSMSTHLPGPRLRARPLEGPDGFLTPAAGGKTRFEYVGLEVPQ